MAEDCGSENRLGSSASSCSQSPAVQSSRNLLHERKKNENGEWKIVRSYEVGAKLGKGGFAKVYLAKEVASSEYYAIKVVSKASLEKDSFKEKTFKELMDRRKKLTEIEIKSHLIQIIESLKYIHSKGIIHRDLKIANIFLNDKMVVKIADFGLSGMIKAPNQKRRTVCGTPNYIAPEVLKNQGHDFVVDNWAVGVIAYTFMYGKPPFEEKEVENTLKNIKANKYIFPENVSASNELRDFITKALVPNPDQRLTLDEMLAHPFLASDTHLIPKYLPASTLALPPTLAYLRRLKKNTMENTPSEVTKSVSQIGPHSSEPATQYNNNNTQNIKQPSQSTKNFDKTNIIWPATTTMQQMSDIESTNNLLVRVRSQENVQFSHHQYQNYLLKTESQQNLQNQHEEQQQQNQQQFQQQQLQNQQRCHSQAAASRVSGSSKPQQTTKDIHENSLPLNNSGNNLKTSIVGNRSEDPGLSSTKSKIIHIAETNNGNTLQQQQLYYQQSSGIANNPNSNLLAQEKTVGMYEYIDCSSKFGLAYCLNNGTVGILLNDGNVVQIVEDEFVHIEKEDEGYKTTKYSIKDLVSLRSDQSKISDECMHLYKLTLNIKEYFLNKFKTRQKTELPECDFGKEMYVKKYILTKQAAFFRFNNKDLQAVFVDRSEVVIAQTSKNVFFKDKKGIESMYSLKQSDKQLLPPDLKKRVNYIKQIFLGNLPSKAQPTIDLTASRGISTNTTTTTQSTSPLLIRTPSPHSYLLQSAQQTSKLQQSRYTSTVTNENSNNGHSSLHHTPNQHHSLHHSQNSHHFPTYLSLHSKPLTTKHSQHHCNDRNTEKIQASYGLGISNNLNYQNNKIDSQTISSLHGPGSSQLASSLQKMANNHNHNNIHPYSKLKQSYEGALSASSTQKLSTLKLNNHQ